MQNFGLSPLEHFDERLDAWGMNNPGQGYVGDNIGPMSIMGGDTHTWWRHFDPETNQVWFRGESYDLQVLVIGIKDVKKRIDALNVE